MKPLHELDPCECHWPVAMRDGEHQFCAEPCGRFDRYCAPHSRVANPAAKPKGPLVFAKTTPIAPARFVGFRADIGTVMGSKNPATKRIAAKGLLGKHVDEDGYETAGREPDLVDLFSGARL